MGRHKKEQDTNLSIYLDYPCKKPNENQINPYCKESIESIKITEEDVYEIIKNNGEKEYGLRKGILYKIADLSGLKWDMESKIIKNEGTSIIYKAVASIRNYLGTNEKFFTTKEFNLALEEETIIKRYTEAGKRILTGGTEEEKEIFKEISVEDWAVNTAKNEIFLLKKNKISIAETYAKIKLIRQIFNIPFFKFQDLSKPIIVKRIDIIVDLSDEKIKEHYLKLALNSSLISSTGSMALFDNKNEKK